MHSCCCWTISEIHRLAWPAIKPRKSTWVHADERNVQVQHAKSGSGIAASAGIVQRHKTQPVCRLIDRLDL